MKGEVFRWVSTVDSTCHISYNIRWTSQKNNRHVHSFSWDQDENFLSGTVIECGFMMNRLLSAYQIFSRISTSTDKTATGLRIINWGQVIKQWMVPPAPGSECLISNLSHRSYWPLTQQWGQCLIPSAMMSRLNLLTRREWESKKRAKKCGCRDRYMTKKLAWMVGGGRLQCPIHDSWWLETKTWAFQMSKAMPQNVRLAWSYKRQELKLEDKWANLQFHGAFFPFRTLLGVMEQCRSVTHLFTLSLIFYS